MHREKLSVGLGGASPGECLAWSFVQHLGDGGELRSAVAAQIAAFGDVDVTTPISRLVSTARTTSALSCSGDGADSPRRFRRFGVILRTRRERTRSAHGDRLDRLVFLVGWHVGVRGELIVGRLAPSWSVLPFAALAGRAAEHPVDRTAEAGKVNS